MDKEAAQNHLTEALSLWERHFAAGVASLPEGDDKRQRLLHAIGGLNEIHSALLSGQELVPTQEQSWSRRLTFALTDFRRHLPDTPETHDGKIALNNEMARTQAALGRTAGTRPRTIASELGQLNDALERLENACAEVFLSSTLKISSLEANLGYALNPTDEMKKEITETVAEEEAKKSALGKLYGLTTTCSTEIKALDYSKPMGDLLAFFEGYISRFSRERQDVRASLPQKICWGGTSDTIRNLCNGQLTGVIGSLELVAQKLGRPHETARPSIGPIQRG